MVLADALTTAVLGRAHAALDCDLRRLTALARKTPPTPDELRDGLEATQAHIAEHFRLEEENGHLESVRQRDPRLGRSIDQLAEDHRQLTRGLDTLVGQARAAVQADEALCAGVRAWVRDLRQHEQRENALVQDAYNLDIGAED